MVVSASPSETRSYHPHSVASDWVNRLSRCIGGLALFGIGIALILRAQLGSAPWDMFHQGISAHTGVDVGRVINIVGLALLVLWVPLHQRVGVGTILNAIEIGVVVDLVLPHLPDVERLVVRVPMMLAGVVIIAIGSGFYIGAGLGTGPRDGIMVGLSERGISVRMARTIIEIAVGVSGIVLGVRPGPGTLVFMFGIGPMVQVLVPRMSLPPRRRAHATAPSTEAGGTE